MTFAPSCIVPISSLEFTKTGARRRCPNIPWAAAVEILTGNRPRSTRWRTQNSQKKLTPREVPLLALGVDLGLGLQGKGTTWKFKIAIRPKQAYRSWKSEPESAFTFFGSCWKVPKNHHKKFTRKLMSDLFSCQLKAIMVYWLKRKSTEMFEAGESQVRILLLA